MRYLDWSLREEVGNATTLLHSSQRYVVVRGVIVSAFMEILQIRQRVTERYLKRKSSVH